MLEAKPHPAVTGRTVGSAAMEESSLGLWHLTVLGVFRKIPVELVVL